ncbi:unnamed protein product [Phaedon cochleariae]|uniref:CHK kinase-like domain-containing protein n=1 Tax=Phaedon cochleariae TaxID=80249 RepID=A0A9P0GMG3_PHACE|nr:unnamed protein product [Phaedon cochleariae]
MSVPEIKNLEQLLLQHLDKGKSIVATNISRLTSYGENYGSEMLKVDLTLKDETGHTEELSVVAKLIPESEFFRVLFNVQVSFKVETAFYDTIVPALQEFQRQHGVTKVIDNFAKFYGARTSLEGEVVNEDAALILENLKVQGYANVDRHTGFDLRTTLHLLSVIAKFHAVPLALKLQDIETFNRKVKPFFACSNPRSPKPPVDHILPMLLKALEAKESCIRLLPKLSKSLKHFGGVVTEDFREPFATISHKDMWVNNLMVKFEAGEPVDSKIVDFQMYSYDSPVVDLLFFLMTSVETEVLKANLDCFLEHYHRVFIDTLKSLGCDVEPFSYKNFMEEIAVGVERELAHACFMLCFVVRVKNPMVPPDGAFDGPPPAMEEVHFSDDTLDRVCWILEECDRRGWMNF